MKNTINYIKQEKRLLSYIQMHIDLGKKEIEVPQYVWDVIYKMLPGRRFDKVRHLVKFKIVPYEIMHSRYNLE